MTQTDERMCTKGWDRRPGPALECFVPFEQNRILFFFDKSGHLINVDPQFAK